MQMIIILATLLVNKCAGFPSREHVIKFQLNEPNMQLNMNLSSALIDNPLLQLNLSQSSTNVAPIRHMKTMKHVYKRFHKTDRNVFDFSNRPTTIDEKVSTTSSKIIVRGALSTSPTRVSLRNDYKPKVRNKIKMKSDWDEINKYHPSDEMIRANIVPIHFNSSRVNNSHMIKNSVLNENLNPEPNENRSVNLDAIEIQLAHTKEKVNHDLFLAISILQHRMFPEFEDSSEEGAFRQDSDVGIDIRNSIDRNIQSKIDNEHRNVNENRLTVTDIKQKLKKVNSGFYKIKSLHHLHWFVLVMKGDCSLVRHRMSAFVTFLKAALSTKLSTNYDDIYVPSVYCDKTFLINISLDLGKYPSAEKTLQTMAQANTTLLEISGEIFYLEKILTQRSTENGSLFFNRNADVEIVIYIAIGCMCFFILLSLVTVALIKICRQEPNDHFEPITRISFPIRKPNVIYSTNFSQSLNPDKFSLSCQEELLVSSEESVAICSESPIMGGSLNPSITKLLDEVDDEEEEDLDEDYQEEEEEDEEDDYDEDDYDDHSRGLGSPSSALVLPNMICSESSPQFSFDNPCCSR